MRTVDRASEQAHQVSPMFRQSDAEYLDRRVHTECCFALRTQMAVRPMLCHLPEHISTDGTLCRLAERLLCPVKRGSPVKARERFRKGLGMVQLRQTIERYKS